MADARAKVAGAIGISGGLQITSVGEKISKHPERTVRYRRVLPPSSSRSPVIHQIHERGLIRMLYICVVVSYARIGLRSIGHS